MLRAKIVAIIGSVILNSRPFAKRGAAQARSEEAEIDAEESDFLESALAEIPDLEPGGEQQQPRPAAGPRDKRETAEVIDDEELQTPAPTTRAAPPKKPDDEPVAPVDDKSGQPAPGAQAAVVPSTVPDDDDPELEKELEQFDAKSPQTREGIGALKKFVRARTSAYKQEKQQLEERLQAAEKDRDELKTQVPSDEERRRTEALLDNIRNTAIEQDPEFQVKYDEAINKIGGDLTETLRGWGMKEQVAKVISDRGGIISFADSQTAVGKQFTNEDGSEMTEQQFFEKYIFAPLSDMQKQQVTSMLVAARSKNRERQAEIQRVKANAPEFLKKRHETAIKTFNTRAQSTLTKLISELPEDMPRDVMPIPEKATKEERARIEADNEDFKAANNYILEKIMANTPEDRAEVAFYAALGKHLLLKERKRYKDDAASLRDRAEKAEKALNDIKDAQRISTKRNAPITRDGHKPPDRKMTDEEAVDAGLP